jgi:CDP-diacylglycerol--glycerol-3-phosphate 3-phosphatidyltransferase
MRHLPNILSCFRIVLSPLLLLLADNPIPFVILYLFCGISDLVDGYIARRFKLQTLLGAKLDSLADFIFFSITFFLLLFYKGIEITLPVILCCIAITAIRTLNLLLTQNKFKQWGVMHTLGNKASGLILFLSMPICILVGQIPHSITILLGTAAIFSSLEETLLLLTSTTYDANQKSILKNYKKVVP